MLTLPARMSCAKRLPSEAADSARSEVICKFCGAKGSEAAMLPIYPQADVVAWCCSGCQCKMHDRTFALTSPPRTAGLYALPGKWDRGLQWRPNEIDPRRPVFLVRRQCRCDAR